MLQISKCQIQDAKIIGDEITHVILIGLSIQNEFSYAILDFEIILDIDKYSVNQYPRRSIYQ